MRLFDLMFAALLCSAAGADDSIVFKASFDRWNTAADVAGTSGTLPGSIPSDLQLKMHPDVARGTAANALLLTTPEQVVYPLKGNFRPDRGTISFWVKPCNYTLTESKYTQIFLIAEAEDFQLCVEKYFEVSEHVLFQIIYKGASNFVYAPAKWKADEWHKLDLTWDPYGMATYIDGRLPTPRIIELSPSKSFSPPFELPKKLEGGTLAVNRQYAWPRFDATRATAFDELEIRDRKLSAKEIYEAFARQRPDLATNAAPVVASEEEDVRLTYECHPAEKKFIVSVDLLAVRLKQSTDIPGVVKLVDRKSGQIVARADVVFAEPDSKVELPFGDVLREGHDYDLVASVPSEGVEAKAVFRMCDLSFVRERAGADGSVPKPWHPVRDLGDGRFAVLDRTYSFTDGPFPSQIVSRDEPLLVERPALVVDGKPVMWQETEIEKVFPDHVLFKTRGTAEGLSLAGRTELWFDGFCLTRFGLQPTDGVRKIGSLKMSWATPRDAARHLLTPLYKKWEDDRFDGVFKVNQWECPMVWTAGVEKGLVWWCESEANWVRKPDAKNVHLVRTDDRAVVTLDIIGEAVTLSNRAEYVMAFEGTPQKRPDHQARVENYGVLLDGKLKGVSCLTCGWCSDCGKRFPDNMRHWTSLVPTHPEDFGKFLDEKRRDGIAEFIYAMPTHISELDREWDYFGASWLKHPGYRWTFKDETTGRTAGTQPCCGHTEAGDWHAANVRKILDAYPQLAGIYYDVCQVEPCDNALHGHGGIDAFGQAYVSSSALSLRSYFLRVTRIVSDRGRRYWTHAHSAFYPFVHGLAHVWWPGEELFPSAAEDPVNFYFDGLSEAEYQSVYNPELRGMDIHFQFQSYRAMSMKPELLEKYGREAFEGRDVVRGHVLLTLLYDLKLTAVYGDGTRFIEPVWKALGALKMDRARFHPYWQDPVAETAPGIRTALYSWGDPDAAVPFLLVVGNTSREDKVSGLRVDWRKIGVLPCPLKDLLTDEVLSEWEWATKALRSHLPWLLVPVR